MGNQTILPFSYARNHSRLTSNEWQRKKLQAHARNNNNVRTKIPLTDYIFLELIVYRLLFYYIVRTVSGVRSRAYECVWAQICSIFYLRQFLFKHKLHGAHCSLSQHSDVSHAARQASRRPSTHRMYNAYIFKH